jgi:hypothetical protein
MNPLHADLEASTRRADTAHKNRRVASMAGVDHHD